MVADAEIVQINVCRSDLRNKVLLVIRYETKHSTIRQPLAMGIVH